jgi:hypothetical protein
MASSGMIGCSPLSGCDILMPHKHNADRRHHIPKMAFKVQNWPAYEAGLRRRGSLTLWIEDAALEGWQTMGPNGQARYRDAAIQTSLMLRTAFKLALRQTESLITSVLALMDLTLSAPDPQHGPPPGGDVASDPVDVSAGWSAACVDRQHGPASLRSGSMAGGQTWREGCP